MVKATNQLAEKIRQIKANDTAVVDKDGFKKDLDVLTIEKSSLHHKKHKKDEGLLHKF